MKKVPATLRSFALVRIETDNHLVGYGADAINPYLSFEALCQARREGRLPST